MAKYYQTTHTHPFQWEQVASAIFQRYPNPFATHVLSEDTLLRRVSADGSLYSRRFLTKTNKVPKWGERFLPGSLKRVVPLVEESVVDPANRIIVTYTRNVGLSRFMSAVEKVVYTANPANPSETVATKEAWFESGLYGLRSAVKSFGVERFKRNCIRATDGFNVVLASINSTQHVHYLNQVSRTKWREIKDRGEVIKVTAKYAADLAKAHSTVHADGDTMGAAGGAANQKGGEEEL